MVGDSKLAKDVASLTDSDAVNFHCLPSPSSNTSSDETWGSEGGRDKATRRMKPGGVREGGTRLPEE